MVSFILGVGRHPGLPSQFPPPVLYHLLREQILPVSRAEAWDFFSTPRNLDFLTPPDVGFVTRHRLAEKMHEGQIIAYRIKLAPLLWVPWITEIRGVEDGRAFIDEQRFGPYKFWHHRHVFEDVPGGGVKVTDLVHYMMPMGLIGDLVNTIYARPRLEQIFDYRARVMAERFGTPPA